jgi:hypothetical protein
MPRKTYRAGGEGENEEDDPDPEAEVDVEREDVGGVGAVEARAQPQQPVDDEQQQQQARLTGDRRQAQPQQFSRVRFHSWNIENGLKVHRRKIFVGSDFPFFNIVTVTNI